MNSMIQRLGDAVARKSITEDAYTNEYVKKTEAKYLRRESYRAVPLFTSTKKCSILNTTLRTVFSYHAAYFLSAAAIRSATCSASTFTPAGLK